jgi:hypothetical protein
MTGVVDFADVRSARRRKVPQRVVEDRERSLSRCQSQGRK